MSMENLPPRSLNAVLIGDACHDRYFFGTCTRLSPEAPVPILKMERQEIRPGMVLNVAANLEGLGVKTHIIAPPPITTKDRYIDTTRMTHLLRVDHEESPDPFDISKLTSIEPSLIDAVVVADYNKGFVSLAALEEITRWCSYHFIPCFIDTKKVDLHNLWHPILKLNEFEYRRVKKFPENGYDMIVTEGASGASWAGRKFLQEPVQMFDVCGAGDTFMAGLVCQYIRSKDMALSIEFANRCARVAVQHFGTYAIRQDDKI